MFLARLTREERNGWMVDPLCQILDLFLGTIFLLDLALDQPPSTFSFSGRARATEETRLRREDVNLLSIAPRNSLLWRRCRWKGCKRPLKEGLTGSRKRMRKIMKEISCRSESFFGTTFPSPPHLSYKWRFREVVHSLGEGAPLSISCLVLGLLSWLCLTL